LQRGSHWYTVECRPAGHVDDKLSVQSSGSYPVNNVGVVVDDVAYRILSLFRRRARQTRHVPAVHTTAAAARFQPYLRQLASLQQPRTNLSHSDSLNPSVPSTLIIHHPFTLSFQAQNLPFLQIFPTVAFLFFFRTDSTDFPDCLLILLRLSVSHFLVFGSVRQIKLTNASF